MQKHKIYFNIFIDAKLCFLGGEDDSVVLCLEPLHGVLLVETVRTSNAPSLAAPVTNILTGATKDYVEVHAVDTNAGVVP